MSLKYIIAIVQTGFSIALVGFAGYGIAKGLDLHVSERWSTFWTMTAIFLFGFAEGID